jgi:hypothetical protein
MRGYTRRAGNFVRGARAIVDPNLPASAALSFGTAGCNLACKFCQKWDMSNSREMNTLADRASPSELAAAAGRLGYASIAYTYNDPTVFVEYAIDVANPARTRGVRSVAVTAATCARNRVRPLSRRDSRRFTPPRCTRRARSQSAHAHRRTHHACAQHLPDARRNRTSGELRYPHHTDDKTMYIIVTHGIYRGTPERTSD